MRKRRILCAHLKFNFFIGRMRRSSFYTYIVNFYRPIPYFYFYVIYQGPVAMLPVTFRCRDNCRTFQSLKDPETGKYLSPCSRLVSCLLRVLMQARDFRKMEKINTYSLFKSHLTITMFFRHSNDLTCDILIHLLVFFK